MKPFLTLSIILMSMLPALGCGGGGENSIPDASAPPPEGSLGLTAEEAARMQKLEEEAGGDPEL